MGSRGSVHSQPLPVGWAPSQTPTWGGKTPPMPRGAGKDGDSQGTSRTAAYVDNITYITQAWDEL
jgi:hypothetical protein